MKESECFSLLNLVRESSSFELIKEDLKNRINLTLGLSEDFVRTETKKVTFSQIPSLQKIPLPMQKQETQVETPKKVNTPIKKKSSQLEINTVRTSRVQDKQVISQVQKALERVDFQEIIYPSEYSITPIQI